MSEILTNDKNHLLLFDDRQVDIDKRLPKWVNAEKYAEENFTGEKVEFKIRGAFNRYDSTTNGISTFADNSEPFSVNKVKIYGVDKDSEVFFDNIASASLKELSAIINEGTVPGFSMIGDNIGFGMAPNRLFSESQTVIKNTFWTKLKNFFSKNKKEDKPVFDAVEFFTNIKLASKESAEKYKDRVSNYLKAIKNARLVGQTALVENLLKEMVVNKYEALLASIGKYYAIKEEQVVDFVKKTEKGVSLCYIKNFARPIPEEVVMKIAEANELEIYDNYVVLYFDPEGKVYSETEKEAKKRKDPIIFGVIAGSNKLYYVTDWIDEYCDLTLEKFVDTLGIEKDELELFADTKKKEEKQEEKTPKTTRRKKKAEE